jgi:hypothetical protein
MHFSEIKNRKKKCSNAAAAREERVGGKRLPVTRVRDCCSSRVEANRSNKKLVLHTDLAIVTMLQLPSLSLSLATKGRRNTLVDLRGTESYV